MSLQEINLLDHGNPEHHISDRQLAPSIFHESWWLDLASNGTYREVIATCGGSIAGRLPYIRSQIIPGFKKIGMPPMTHVLGPALAPELTEAGFPRSLRQISVIRDLLAQLPPASHISFRLHGGLTNTLAFAEAGFSSHVDYTVEIPPNSSNLLWRQMRDKTRNVIRRAQEQLTVSSNFEPEIFLQFYQDNLKYLGLTNHYDRIISHNLIAECLARGSGRILTALDAAGRIQSAIFTIWDRGREYYFMSTRAADSMNGATSLLIWTAIQHAAELGLIFDMDIIHVKQNHLPNLRLLTGFGGALKPRYVVRRTAPALQLARQLRNLLARTPQSMS